MSARPARPHSLLRTHRYAMLFFSLLLTVAIGPLLETLRFGRPAMEAFLAINLLAAVFPIVALAERRVLYALIGVALVLRWVTTGGYESPLVAAPISPLVDT